MKIRARIKPAEEMPEWSKCCPQMIAGYIERAPLMGEFIIDTDITIVRQNICRFCGRTTDEKLMVWIVNQPLDRNKPWISYEHLDLDEGPIKQEAR